jgi:ATP-dependent DNA helicase DinG
MGAAARCVSRSARRDSNRAAFRRLGSQLEDLGAGAGTANCARRAGKLAAGLGELRATSDDDGLRWVETGPAGLALQFTPFEIAARLREYVESRPCAWVFTSATLAIGDDFSHFAARVGLPDARTLRSKVRSTTDNRR